MKLQSIKKGLVGLFLYCPRGAHKMCAIGFKVMKPGIKPFGCFFFVL